MIPLTNCDLPQCRDLLREGLLGGEEKHRANSKKENRGEDEYFVDLKDFILPKNALF